MTPPVKIGMISMAHGHAHAYMEALLAMPQADIAGIAHPSRDEVADVLARTGIPYYADYRELLQTDIDAVVICSENALHARHTIDAAMAGKHILCEKPLGIEVGEMTRMIDACREGGVQLMTAFPCRYLTAAEEARQAILRGEIGEILAFKGTNRGTFPGSWFADSARSGGGALLDHSVHVLDLLHWMMPGAAVREVYAYAANRFQPEHEIDDAGMLHVTFDNGACGVIDTSWSRPRTFPTWGDVTLEIVGSAGVLSLDAFAQHNEVYSDAAGKGAYAYWGDGMDELMVRAFVDAVRSGRPVPITGADGLHAARAALAGYDSVRSGQPVRLA
ncbi:Gfo/Idh/MocA family oxidoreductase [Paenibacillus sp. IB182496]|uniref:Gfo/Idh/MocA family oxidoreductase n=1 Tax=Paenibacillus sabuli TaxID=2772509 RepID=A0A927BYQ7_9BACL|nr:Gfo/Idh/MocA family oxidoreductase [Paenibacillus sabuli]MBD2847869.1 Gfo/Idh/MocA family oxidoreductase [Paenibacillus sabuli]